MVCLLLAWTDTLAKSRTICVFGGLYSYMCAFVWSNLVGCVFLTRLLGSWIEAVLCQVCASAFFLLKFCLCLFCVCVLLVSYVLWLHAV